MTDQAYDSAKRSLEISKEIRQHVAEQHAELDRRVSELERRFDAVLGGEREPHFDPARTGSRGGAGGLSVRGD